MNRRRRPSADALVRMAGDRSGSLTGSARQAPSLGPLFRARPHPGRCAGTSKGMRAPIGPLRGGFRPPPLAPAKGGRWLRTASAPGLRLPPAASPADSAGSRLCPLGSGYRRLCPPVAPPPSRPPTRLATPYGRLGRLRHSVLRSPSGCSGWSHGPPSAPQRAPSRPFCAEASVGPPRTAPPASCPPSSLGRLAALGGLRAPLLPPGAWSGPGGRFFRPPGPRRREQIQPGGIYLNRRTGRYQGCLTALRRQGRQGPAPPFREIHV